mgnify:CR=1 FL=1
MNPLSVTVEGEYARESDEVTRGEAEADVLSQPQSEALETPKGEEAEEILKRARERYDDWWERDKDNRDEAVKQSAALKDKGFDNYIVNTEGENKNGLSMGLFSQEDSAKAMVKRLNDSGYPAKRIEGLLRAFYESADTQAILNA